MKIHKDPKLEIWMAVAVIKLETEYNSIILKLDKLIKLEDDDCRTYLQSYDWIRIMIVIKNVGSQITDMKTNTYE